MGVAVIAKLLECCGAVAISHRRRQDLDPDCCGSERTADFVSDRKRCGSGGDEPGLGPFSVNVVNIAAVRPAERYLLQGLQLSLSAVVLRVVSSQDLLDVRRWETRHL